MSERKIAVQNRGFKGIWIPASYWLDENLSIQEMLFLAEIDSLDIDEKGCYASNKHFSDFFGLTPGRCSQVITSLKDKGYINVELVFDEKKAIKNRTIRVVNKLNTPIKYSKEGYLKNCASSNTGFSNTKRRPKQVYDESSQYFKAAVYLKNLADQNFEFLKEPNLQIWADDIRKLAEIDKQPLSLIKEVIEWCQQDEFWFKNIRSASKLRKQFETLTLQMAAKKPKVKTKANQTQNINVNELSKLFGDV